MTDGIFVRSILTGINGTQVISNSPTTRSRSQLGGLSMHEVILSMDELSLDQAPQDIHKDEFLLERVRLQAFVAATDPGCKKELIRSDSLWVY
ncbi:hypothetical protein TNCV_3145741 [Trichonephila clavipes]|nr:hypothetical protein TNCV_3145741 [Trichonephila clavipes]